METGTLRDDVEGGIRWLAAEVESGRRIGGGRRIVRREWRRGNRGGILGSKERIVRIVRTFFPVVMMMRSLHLKVT